MAPANEPTRQEEDSADEGEEVDDEDYSSSDDEGSDGYKKGSRMGHSESVCSVSSFQS